MGFTEGRGTPPLRALPQLIKGEKEKKRDEISATEKVSPVKFPVSGRGVDGKRNIRGGEECRESRQAYEGGVDCPHLSNTFCQRERGKSTMDPGQGRKEGKK